MDIPKVTVEDESIKAVGIILHAIHLQGHLVPETVSYSLLRHLAIVCDKYDLRKSLGTWPETWAKSHADKMEQPRNESLFIAVAFKLDAVFPKITKSLILGTRTLDDGTMVTIYNQVIGEDIPEVILGKFVDPIYSMLLRNPDQIKSVRMETIVAIEKRLWTLQQPIQNVETACRHYDAEDFDSDDDDDSGPSFCQLLQLGILKRKLFYLEHPHSESPFRKRSLYSIMSDVEDIKNTVPEALRPHERCLRPLVCTHTPPSVLERSRVSNSTSPGIYIMANFLHESKSSKAWTSANIFKVPYKM